MIAQDLQLPLPLDDLRAMLREHGVRKASVFGSYARGEATKKSDLDLLVELEPGRTYLDLGGLYYDFEEQFAIRLDIATKLNQRLEPYITPDLTPIL